MSRTEDAKKPTTHTRVFCTSIQKLRVAVVIAGMKLHDGSLTREASRAVEAHAKLLLERTRDSAQDSSVAVSDETDTSEQEDTHSADSDDPFDRLFRELSDDRSASCTPKGEAHTPDAEHTNTKRVKVER